VKLIGVYAAAGIPQSSIIQAMKIISPTNEWSGRHNQIWAKSDILMEGLRAADMLAFWLLVLLLPTFL
jgi:hypothetical protein